MNQINQTNKTNQINQTDLSWASSPIARIHDGCSFPPTGYPSITERQVACLNVCRTIPPDEGIPSVEESQTGRTVQNWTLTTDFYLIAVQDDTL